jgi:hypothetical protein
MGKKPVLGIVSALCVGLALTGCRNCSSCQSDNVKVTKDGPATFKPQPTFQTNTAAAAPSAQGWNNSATTLPKPSSAAPADASAPLGMDKSGLKATEPLATSKPMSSGVQPATFVPPPAPADAAAPVDANTSHFPPQTTGRILPSPPALPTGSSLPPLPDDRPFPAKVEESTAMPLPPPPPPPSMSHSPANDAPPLSPETQPSPPSPSLIPGTLPPPPPAPPGPNG